jgi:catalase
MGTPDGYRFMDGFGVNTYKLVNNKGKRYWVKFHMISDSGLKNLTLSEATRLAGEDPDYATRDLFDYIKSGKEASWTLHFQIIPYEQGFKYRFNIFDPTKTVDTADYPLIPVGKLVLNRNPSNFFAEVEQSAFNVANMVPGIEPSPDRTLHGRLFSYSDTQVKEFFFLPTKIIFFFYKRFIVWE